MQDSCTCPHGSCLIPGWRIIVHTPWRGKRHATASSFFFFASYITVFPHVLTVVVHGLYLHLFPPAVPRDQYPLWSALTAAFSLQFVQLTNINPLHSTHFFFFTSLRISSSLSHLRKNLCAENPPAICAKGLIKLLSISAYFASLYVSSF